MATDIKRNIIICYSGGLDSFLLWQLYKHQYSNTNNCKCIFYDIGQPYVNKELKSIKDSGVEVQIKKIDWLDNNSKMIGKEGSLSGDIIIPGRNALLATMAACQEQPDEIWMGALQGEIHEKSTDKNYKFLDKWNNLMQYVLQKNVVLKFPFADMGFGKFEVIEWALKNAYVTKEQLINTSSCLSGEDGKCGKCVVCFRRWGIFYQLGFSEEYTVFPLSAPQNKMMIIEMIKGELGEKCHYDEYRRRELIPAILKYWDCDLDGAKIRINE